MEFGIDTRIRLWNPSAERIFGWSSEEMIGRGGLPMAPPDRRAEAEDLFQRVIAGETVNDYETARLRKDGALVPVSIAAAPVRDASGHVIGNMVAYTDITERKAQEAEVHRLNDELHARLEELAASRARIVTAGDVERRRLERNLHDGAQQRLVALALSLRLVAGKLESEPDAARELLDGAGRRAGARARRAARARARPASGGAHRPRPAPPPSRRSPGRRRCRSSSRRSRTSGCPSPSRPAPTT